MCPNISTPLFYVLDIAAFDFIDSSRFWPQDGYVAGQAQDSFDKQYLRDWLTRNSLAGSKDVTIPEDVVQETARKYKQVFRILTETQWTE